MVQIDPEERDEDHHQDEPRCQQRPIGVTHVINRNNTPVTNSTSGYCGEIGALQ